MFDFLNIIWGGGAEVLFDARSQRSAHTKTHSWETQGNEDRYNDSGSLIASKQSQNGNDLGTGLL
ncbi:hypothetical protein [Lyngbya sp. PCC 8106]|uniref:hypothetical protein n=1 Tax=Lyngbya sp. (strain PCC 8106) TaxID=313612 RepID=UPI0002FDC1FD|nr:hypothetical protein [Lyngbya sp. PCC 8106]